MEVQMAFAYKKNQDIYPDFFIIAYMFILE